MRAFREMVLMSFLLALVTISDQPSAIAGTAEMGSCKATAFPYSRKQSKKDFARLFAKLDRNALREYYFHELTIPLPRDSVGHHLGTYLSNTEIDKDWRAFYETLEWASDHKLDLTEICEVYQRVLSSKLQEKLERK
jgi:hypothetical protein